MSESRDATMIGGGLDSRSSEAADADAGAAPALPRRRHFSAWHLPRPRRTLTLIAVLAVLGVAGALAFHLSERYGIDRMREDVSHQIDILAAAIDNEATRHASIPSAIELNPDVLALLRAPEAARSGRQAVANRYLQQLNDALGGPAIFVLDTGGRVVASSDWIYSDNLLGKDLSYLPLFRSAAAGVPARHYAIDTIRQEPGFFIALPIRDATQDWRVIGVAVVQSGIRGLERRWLAQGAPAVIVDGNGIVLLASPPEWRYATLQRRDKQSLARISREQFAGQPVGEQSLDIAVDEAGNGTVVRLPKHLRGDMEPAAGARTYLALSRSLPGTAWRMVVFSDLRPVAVQAATHSALVVAAFGCLLLGLLYLNQRRRRAREREEARRLLQRANQDLERKVGERTADLSDAVMRLRQEVGDRQRAEQTLRAAQDELVQAAKLAVLGRMATGITHELAQPLGAIRTLSANAAEFMRRGDQATAEKNLTIVGQLTQQMADIITPLKTFARKSPAVPAPVDISRAVDAALFLFDQRLRRQEVAVDKALAEGEWMAWCDHNRLQQVLVNLVGNASDAMVNRPGSRIAFAALRREDGHIALTVSDNGPGFADHALAHLFEPFFTTKQPGEGLGLGLTISRDILRDFGGDLLADRAPGGGARFTVLLPPVPSAAETKP